LHIGEEDTKTIQSTEACSLNNNNNNTNASCSINVNKQQQSHQIPQKIFFDVWSPSQLNPNTIQTNVTGGKDQPVLPEPKSILDAFSGYTEYLGNNALNGGGGFDPAPPFGNVTTGNYMDYLSGQPLNESSYYSYYQGPVFSSGNINNYQQYRRSPLKNINANSSPLEDYLDLSMPVRGNGSNNNTNGGGTFLDTPYYQFQDELQYHHMAGGQQAPYVSPLSLKFTANGASAYCCTPDNNNSSYESSSLPHYGHVRPSDIINPELYHAINNSTQPNSPTYPNLSVTFSPLSPNNNCVRSKKGRRGSAGRRRKPAQFGNIVSGFASETEFLSNSPPQQHYHQGTSNPPVVFGPNGEIYQKPPYSYAALITRALRECDGGKLTLSGIYEWIKEQFPYYRTAEAAWQVLLSKLTLYH
jgi:hypothetical protein